MPRITHMYQSSVGKKILMAVSGLILIGFVFGHMAGNLKIFQGAEKYNAYAEGLRTLGKPLFGYGQALWVARIALLAALAVHLHAALTLTLQSKAARPTRYKKQDDISFSYASRTMRWGGVIVLLFVVYHLLHLTWGSVHPNFSHESVYANVVSGFKVWPASLAYMIAIGFLGLHIYHGLWSATQTLALRSARVRQFRRPVAAALSILMVLGNWSMPIAAMAGILK